MDFTFLSKTSDYGSFMNGNGLLIAIFSVLFCHLLYSVTYGKNTRRKLPPGPVGVPFLGYIPFLGTEPYETLRKLSKKYGGLISVYMRTKYTVVINEYDFLKEILSHPGALDRAPGLFVHVPNSGFLTENGPRWTEQRRFCIHATRDIGLGKGTWEDYMMEEVNNFIKKIHRSQGKPVDIDNDLIASVSSNIISLLIGRRLDEDVEKDKIQLCVDYSHIAMTYMGPLNPSALIPGLRRFCEVFRIAGFDRALQIQDNFFAFLRQEVQRHKNETAQISRNDFMSMYLEKIEELSSGSKSHSFSESTLEGNVHVLFLGSSDTITSSLECLIRLMAKYKDVQQHVHAELMEAFGKEGRVLYSERHRIPYTFAVLMENLRFSKIGPISVTRKASQDIPVKDYVIPRGAEILPNIWAIHHDPAYWSDPDEFRPERFLTEDGKSLIKHPPSYVPFSFGKRNCPGETIAWMEILFYFSEIIKNFEITTPLGAEPEFKVIPGLVCRLEPQKLCFKKRI